MKTLIKLSATVLLTFNFSLSTFYCFAQANEPGSGNCLEFDGVNDYVRISDTSQWDFGTGSFSISAWFKTNTGPYDGIITYDDALVKGAWRLELASNRVRFLICHIYRPGNCTAIASPNVVNDNKWHHAVGVRDASAGVLRLFIDGVMVGTPVSDGGYNIVGSPAAYPAIGRIGSYSLCCNFHGQIDEVRVWNYARSQTEIREDMCRKLTGSEPGLVGYWRLDEGSGNTAFDSSPNAKDGTLY